MNESVLEQVCRQEQQISQMIGMTPNDRQEYLRFTNMARQSMSQGELFQLQRIQPSNPNCSPIIPLGDIDIKFSL